MPSKLRYPSHKWKLDHICSKVITLPLDFFELSIFGKSIVGNPYSVGKKTPTGLNVENFRNTGFPEGFCTVLEHGLPLLLRATPPQRIVKNHTSAVLEENTEFVTRTLQKWEDMEVIEYLLEKPHLVNPFSIVTNGTKKRLVLDAKASGLNDHILAPKFTLPSIETVANTLYQGDFMIKMDLANGFLQLPIQVAERKYLGFRNPVDGRFGVVKRLPFGLRSAPFLFASFTHAIKEAAKQVLNITTQVYIDDWLLTNRNRPELMDDFTEFSEFLNYLGVTIQHEKTEGPSQIVTYLGLQLDTCNKRILLPEQKRIKYLLGLQDILQGKAKTMAALAKTAGRLVHIATVHKAGAANIQPLWDVLYLDKKQWTKVQLEREELTMNKDLEECLHWWENTLSEQNIQRDMWKTAHGQLFLWSKTTAEQHPELAKTICTDASDIGWGASTGIVTIAGKWSLRQQLASINWRELKTVNIAISKWEFIKNTPILILTDSSTIVAAIRKRASRAEALQNLIRELAHLEKTRKLEVVAIHIQGELNDLPDKLSREQATDQASILSFQPQTLPEEIRTITQLHGLTWDHNKFDSCLFYRHKQLILQPTKALIAVSSPDIPFLKLHIKKLTMHNTNVYLLIPKIPTSELPIPCTEEIKSEEIIVCNNALQSQWKLLIVLQNGRNNEETVTNV